MVVEGVVVVVVVGVVGVVNREAIDSPLLGRFSVMAEHCTGAEHGGGRRRFIHWGSLGDPRETDCAHARARGREREREVVVVVVMMMVMATMMEIALEQEQ